MTLVKPPSSPLPSSLSSLLPGLRYENSSSLPFNLSSFTASTIHSSNTCFGKSISPCFRQNTRGGIGFWMILHNLQILGKMVAAQRAHVIQFSIQVLFTKCLKPDDNPAVCKFASLHILQQSAICWLLVFKDEILHVETSQPSGRWFSFAPSTKTSFGTSDPMLSDPFEERVVNIAKALFGFSYLPRKTSTTLRQYWGLKDDTRWRCEVLTWKEVVKEFLRGISFKRRKSEP